MEVNQTPENIAVVKAKQLIKYHHSMVVLMEGWLTPKNLGIKERLPDNFYEWHPLLRFAFWITSPFYLPKRIIDREESRNDAAPFLTVWSFIYFYILVLFTLAQYSVMLPLIWNQSVKQEESGTQYPVAALIVGLIFLIAFFLLSLFVSYTRWIIEIRVKKSKKRWFIELIIFLIASLTAHSFFIFNGFTKFSELGLLKLFQWPSLLLYFLVGFPLFTEVWYLFGCFAIKVSDVFKLIITWFFLLADGISCGELSDLVDNTVSQIRKKEIAPYEIDRDNISFLKNLSRERKDSISQRINIATVLFTLIQVALSTIAVIAVTKNGAEFLQELIGLYARIFNYTQSETLPAISIIFVLLSIPLFIVLITFPLYMPVKLSKMLVIEEALLQTYSVLEYVQQDLKNQSATPAPVIVETKSRKQSGLFAKIMSNIFNKRGVD